MNMNIKIDLGFSVLLTIVFIILKVTNVVAWSWLWILSPIWITFTLAIIGIIFACIAISVARKHM